MTTYIADDEKVCYNNYNKCMGCRFETLPVPPEKAIAFICPGGEEMMYYKIRKKQGGNANGK